MFDATAVPIAQLAHDVSQSALFVGPPGGLPEQVPDFVSNILSVIGDSAGDAAGGLGERISGLTPGGEGGAPGN